MKYKFSEFKNNKKLLLLLIGLLGIVFVLVSGYKSGEKPIENAPVSELDYIKNLEQRIETIISTMDGAGKCDVMINVGSSAESVYVKENKKSYDTSTEQNRGESEDSVLTMKDSDGGEYALISKKLMPDITGVIITCDGGDNALVKSRVIEAVCTLLGIGSNNICVISKS
jgi:stage III sporulation protein AG